jgi:muconolactone delta-isomerase
VGANPLTVLTLWLLSKGAQWVASGSVVRVAGCTGGSLDATGNMNSGHHPDWQRGAHDHEPEDCEHRTKSRKAESKAPGNFKIELFVIRVGDWGGYMLLDCDDPRAVHKFCSMLPAFVFEARPVIPIDDAVRVELESIAFRDGLKTT